MCKIAGMFKVVLLVGLIGVLLSACGEGGGGGRATIGAAIMIGLKR